MIPNWLSLLDVAFVLVALLFAWGGFQKGFAGQVAHVVTFLGMGAVLYFAYPAIFRYLGRLFRNVEETYLMWLILLGVLAMGVGMFILCSKLLARTLKTHISEQSDHAYGFILGLVRGTLVALFAMVFMVMLDASGKAYDTFRTKSRVGRVVCYKLVPHIQPHLTRAVLEEKARALRDKLLEQEDAGVLE